MAKTWFKYFIIILPISFLAIIYSSFNVPSNNFRTTPKIEYSKQIKIDNDNVNIHKSERKQSSKDKCDSINIGMVCAGYSSTQSLITAVKSILFYRSKPLHFHFLVNEISKRTLKVLFDTWNLPQVKATFYPADLFIPKISWIPNKHYSGVYGLLKLIIPDIINVDKIIVLDTDIIVLNDISHLWDIFNDFYDNDNYMLGLVENQSDWYIKKIVDNNQKPWPAISRGFNTGVILMHIDKLKSFKFNHLWINITKQYLIEYFETTLADQDIINALIKNIPSIVYTLKCHWNVQLSDHTNSNQCYYSNTKQINILHWNSPHKQDVRNKHSNDFNQIYRIFLEMNGNLLRRRIFGCEEIQNNSYVNQSDKCDKFIKGSKILYRTQLFLKEYEYNNYIENDVGLVTQCSADRLILLDELCKRWPGTISIAVYLTDAEVQSFIDFIRGSQILKNRKNVAYHVVYKDGEFYPINYLRNVATSHIQTPFIIQLDIDFLPPIDLHSKLISYIAKLNASESDKKAFIIPAFETQRYRFTFPNNKGELLKYLNYGILYTFRYHVWAKGHAATNYTYWKTAKEPYEIEWEPDFEPYIMVSKSAPLYDERFIGFGWNKVSYITHLTALGYRYIVLPDVFIIHRPHAPSLDIGKFRTDVSYRKCLKHLKDKFLSELISKYGENALTRTQKTTKE